MLERFIALASQDQAHQLAYQLKTQGNFQPETLFDSLTLAEAIQRYGIVRKNGYVIHPDVLQRIQEQAQSILAEFHQQHPLLVGMDQKTFFRLLKIQDHTEIALNILLGEGGIIVEGGMLKLKGAGMHFTKAQRRQIDALLQQFTQNPFSPPSFKDAAQQIGDPLLKTLLSQRALIYLPPDVLLLPESYQELVAYARQILEKGATLTLGELRDHFQTSRRIAMPFLDLLERKGITRRTEDGHLLQQANWTAIG